MKRSRILIPIATLIFSILLAACLHASDSSKNPGALTKVTPTKSEQVLPSGTFLAMSPAMLQYRAELEKAAAKRMVAKDRCTGMVGSAKNVCLFEADQLYDALARLAEARNIPNEVASSHAAN